VIRVCGVEDVPPGEGRAVEVGDRRVAVFRAEDAWFALDATCPHRGGPLADGIVARRTVICPLHERRFDLATGQECAGGYAVAAYRVEVRGGEVYLELGVDVESASAGSTPAGSSAPAELPTEPAPAGAARSRRALLQTTKVEDNAIAAPATKGLSRPAAAIGIAARL
jgi:nitrite reductase (NADH) small subunit